MQSTPQIDIHLLRLYHLRDVVWPLAELREGEGRLDLSLFISGCGTYRCLLGWAVTTEQLHADGWGMTLGGTPMFNRKTAFEAADDYYGLSPGASVDVFGAEKCRGTLAARRAVLERIISERETQRVAA